MKLFNNDYFIRFGDIPENEISVVYSGSGDGQYLKGYEIGVSCYNAKKIKNTWFIVLPHITKTTLNTLHSLYYNFDNRKSYLVKGKLVGYGSDGEPLLKNVKIIKEINLRSNEII